MGRNKTGVYPQPNGRWKAQVTINGTNRPKTFDTQGEAVAWRVRTLAALESGNYIDPRRSGQRLDVWTQRWLEMRKGVIAPGSWARYESIVRLHIEPGLGFYALNQLDLTRIQTWVNTMSPQEAHTRFPVLRTLLSAAVKAGHVPHNPARHVELPHHESKEMTFLEPDELREVLSHVEEQWAHDFIAGLAFTGARFGELAALTPDRVNILKGTIDLYATKTKKWRTIGIAPPLRPVIERRLSQPCEFVFATVRGGKVNNSNFHNRVWQPLCDALELEVRPHDLRHSFASWSIAEGMNVVQVSKWLGHAKVSQTLDTYAHLFADDTEDMADAIGRMWDRDAEPTNVVSLEVAR